MKQKERRLNARGFDFMTLGLIFVLVIFGLAAMTNALADPSSSDMTLGSKLASLNLQRPLMQLAWFAVGLVAVVVISLADYQVFADYVRIAYAVLLFVLVLLLFVAEDSRGVKGWFYIGSVGLQPSEFGKIVLILAVAKSCSKAMDQNDGRLKGAKAILLPVVLTAVPVVLIAQQPDWGTAFVYICILVGMMFAARMSWKVMGSVVLAAVIGLPLAYYFLMTPEQQARILGYLNPGSDSLNTTYHADNALEIVSSGGAFGKGFLAEGTLSQMGYLPESHTDYIFASFVEMAGFVGGIVLIAVYFALLIRTLYISVKARDNFGMLICVGVTSMMFAHVFENIGMIIGIMPVTGIPLPFVSYGGSNMLSSMIAYGFVINVWMRRQQKRKYSLAPTG